MVYQQPTRLHRSPPRPSRLRAAADQLRAWGTSIDDIIRAERILPAALYEGLGLLAFIIAACALIGGDV